MACAICRRLPPVVTGYLLLRFGAADRLVPRSTRSVSRWPLIEGCGDRPAVVAFPLVLRSVRLSIEEIDPQLERAARTLGASKWRTFCTITLPLSLPGLLVGALLAFARSLGEFGATITFVSNIAGQTRTLPAAIYTYLNQPDGEAAAARLVIISVIIALAALIASEWANRRMRSS